MRSSHRTERRTPRRQDAKVAREDQARESAADERGYTRINSKAESEADWFESAFELIRVHPRESAASESLRLFSSYLGVFGVLAFAFPFSKHLQLIPLEAELRHRLVDRDLVLPAPARRAVF